MRVTTVCPADASNPPGREAISDIKVFLPWESSTRGIHQSDCACIVKQTDVSKRKESVVYAFFSLLDPASASRPSVCSASEARAKSDRLAGNR